MVYGNKDIDGFYQGELRGKCGLVPFNLVRSMDPGEEYSFQNLHDPETSPHHGYSSHVGPTRYDSEFSGSGTGYYRSPVRRPPPINGTIVASPGMGDAQRYWPHNNSDPLLFRDDRIGGSAPNSSRQYPPLEGYAGERGELDQSPRASDRYLPGPMVAQGGGSPLGLSGGTAKQDPRLRRARWKQKSYSLDKYEDLPSSSPHLPRHPDYPGYPNLGSDPSLINRVSPFDRRFNRHINYSGDRRYGPPPPPASNRNRNYSAHNDPYQEAYPADSTTLYGESRGSARDRYFASSGEYTPPKPYNLSPSHANDSAYSRTEASRNQPTIFSDSPEDWDARNKTDEYHNMANSVGWQEERVTMERPARRGFEYHDQPHDPRPDYNDPYERSKEHISTSRYPPPPTADPYYDYGSSEDREVQRYALGDRRERGELSDLRTPAGYLHRQRPQQIGYRDNMTSAKDRFLDDKRISQDGCIVSPEEPYRSRYQDPEHRYSLPTCRNLTRYPPNDAVDKVPYLGTERREQPSTFLREPYESAGHTGEGLLRGGRFRGSFRKQNREKLREITRNAVGRRMVALYDYNPRESSPNVDVEQELSFRAGDAITVYGDMDEDGFYFGNLRGQEGLIPSNFLSEPDFMPGATSIRSGQPGGKEKYGPDGLDNRLPGSTVKPDENQASQNTKDRVVTEQATKEALSTNLPETNTPGRSKKDGVAFQDVLEDLCAISTGTSRKKGAADNSGKSATKQGGSGKPGSAGASGAKTGGIKSEGGAKSGVAKAGVATKSATGGAKASGPKKAAAGSEGAKGSPATQRKISISAKLLQARQFSQDSGTFSKVLKKIQE